MGDKIVIVESPTKARTISRYLGKGYKVHASLGHVRDLPEDVFGVDVEKDFEPTYRLLPGSRKLVGKLRKAVEDADEVYLALDPDREGEAIAWHLIQALNLPEDRVKRVSFHEITRAAVRDAFADAGPVNMQLVDAQQGRRILDRIVGYELSPLISSKIVRGLSAGRVQSVALRLVCDRELEVRAFVPEEYWEIKATLACEDSAQFSAQLAKLDGKKTRISCKKDASSLVEELKEASYTVLSVAKTEVKTKAPPPFTTSTMQQAAGSQLGFTTAVTMRIAQQLYEGIDIAEETAGLITYMRTDSTRVAGQALKKVRGMIRGDYGEQYVPAKPNFFKERKGAQAAHEAVRPTDPLRKPQLVKQYLSRDQYRLYELIWRRFVASQMKPAVYSRTDVEVQAGRAIFDAQHRELVFDGYTLVTPPKSEADSEVLPPLKEGQALELIQLDPSQHFTEPPKRYTESSLVRELEKRGIGRPSTYAPTISTIQKRNYVRREKRTLFASELGLIVAEKLTEHFPREMDYSFTSKMEEQLDEIEEGRQDWRELLREFYKSFREDLAKARDEMTDISQQPLDEPVACEKCGKPMVLKVSRSGDRFLGCSAFPACKNTMSVPSEGPEEEDATEHRCDKCGAAMTLRTGRKGRKYLACSAYPKCRNIMGLDRRGKPVKLEQRSRTAVPCPGCGQAMFWEEETEQGAFVCLGCGTKLPLLCVEEALRNTEMTPEAQGFACEKCGEPMEIKRGRNGLFLSCSRYPECKETRSIGQEELPAPQPTREVCDKCGRPLLLRWGKFGRFLACSGFPGCRNIWRLSQRVAECPKDGCDGRLIKKVSKDGEEFCGCSRYPECDYTCEKLPRKKKGKT